MVKIRLKRLGRKKKPFYRIVVMDVRNRRQGSSLAELGYYNPLSRELKVDKQAAESWISKGATPTEAVDRLLKKAPENGELIVLEKARKERLSKKAQQRQQEQAAAEKTAAPVEAAEQPAAEEAAAEEAVTEEQPAESTTEEATA
jgi:small subunit ribosomal protein S16